MKVKILLLTFFSYLICFPDGFARKNAVANPAKSLQAPALGITSKSVILIWDDPYEPVDEADDFKPGKRLYRIYRNGAEIGSTTQKTFTAKNLSPATDYTFSVVRFENGKEEKWDPVKVATKALGKIVDVRKSGAKGDGRHNDTGPVQRSIDNCPAGGTVYVPAGNYLVGHLGLKSDITVELAKGAVLSFIGYRQGEDLPKTKAILSGPDGDIHYESISLLSGTNVRNVVITGEGIIDANGETWWPYHKEITRPFTVEFINSSDILVQGVTMQDPPFWNNHLLYVDRAIYSDVKFFKVSTDPGVNGDGLNPDASRNILIVGCLFGNQDDAIAIKSGKYFEDQSKRRRSSEHITIRDCVFDGNAAPGAHPLGIAIGSETSGGVRHVLVRDCAFIDAASLANIKANRQRAFACVEDVRIENITYTNTKHTDRWWNHAPISVDLFYGDADNADPSVAVPFSPQTPVFRDIHFRNISVYNPVGKGIYISGLAESPIHDIDFDKVYVRSRDGLVIRHVDVLSVKGILARDLAAQAPLSKPRVVVLTDISSLTQNEAEPDDGQSMIRLLLYTNELDIEGLIATSTLGHGQRVRPELIRRVVDAYGEVQPNLRLHDKRYPPASELLQLVASGQPVADREVPYHQSIGEGKDTEGSELIINTVDKNDPRPLWILAWGGTADLAQALWKVRKLRTKEQLDLFVSKIRVDAVGNQDATGPWIQKEFPNLFYMLRERGIRGMYRGGDTLLTSSGWIKTNIRNHGALGDLYVDYDGGDIWSRRLGKVKGIKEGDTPTFLGLISNGLNDKFHPGWGGWGGRFRRRSADTNQWTEAIDSTGSYLTDPDNRMAAIYRWRAAWQADFASRLAWCIKPYEDANHAPVVGSGHAVLNTGRGKKAELELKGVTDPDNDKLAYKWYFYPEEGTYTGTLPALKTEGPRAEFIAPGISSTLHLIAEVTDDGTPSLTRYKRFIIHIRENE